MDFSTHIQSQDKQTGVALIFTMIFLGLMVAGGLVSIQLSSLQQKMASSYRTSQNAFISAEVALKEAEQCVKDEAACSSLSNFVSNCSFGLCFTGSDKNSIPSCRTGSTQSWDNAALWEDSTRTIEATTLAGTGTSAKYIIEFICYVPKTLHGVTPSPSNPGDWSRLYRITVLASVDNQSNRVMLQSTYKL
ncbi:hypothetical protein ACH42_15990 [Endozoicomonas sp. (ex Bugula neritina AB1)]|nr:hypothetical protein ACH42_15990 [Endozoicomonas sp. (ex Bugula neritina AB1)]